MLVLAQGIVAHTLGVLRPIVADLRAMHGEDVTIVEVDVHPAVTAQAVMAADGNIGQVDGGHVGCSIRRVGGAGMGFKVVYQFNAIVAMLQCVSTSRPL